jgi:hypothetical protein
MVHDPCNPLPNFVIPGGLVPRHRHMAVPQAGHANTALQSHAITSITTTYLGCDHNDHKSTRIKSVQFPPVVNLPAANVPRTSAIAVATLPSFTLPISSFAGIPNPRVPPCSSSRFSSHGRPAGSIALAWHGAGRGRRASHLSSLRSQRRAIATAPDPSPAIALTTCKHLERCREALT